MGEAKVTRDDRGRIVIPSEHYPAFEDAGEVLIGPTPSGEALYVFPPLAWNGLVDRLRQGKEGDDPEAPAFLRLYTSLYRREKIQGKSRRIDLTPDLSRLASLSDNVVVVGRDDRLEVMDESAWRRRTAEILAAVKPMAEKSRWD
jgi:DNA-binding transcriptional regulator/RsmH inhibitor MraZ